MRLTMATRFGGRNLESPKELGFAAAVNNTYKYYFPLLLAGDWAMVGLVIEP